MSSTEPLRHNLRKALDADANRRFVVAYSGGLDSKVLLHAMVDYVGDEKERLLVAHVDHRLHKDSPRWAKQCMADAKGMSVAATVLTIEEELPRGHSVESWARDNRYRLLRSIIQSGDVLLTAHHRDDLAETFFLQLFRGSGPHGLSGIAANQYFGHGLLRRPLLDVTRAEIEAYAETHSLEWIDDPSNFEQRYDRNFIRHSVLPEIEQRWPSVSARIAHAVELQRQAATCLDEAADTVIDAKMDPETSQLLVSTLSKLKNDMQRWVLRRWIVRAGFPIPDAVHLHEMHRLVHARQDAQPCVSWKGAELRRYRDKLFLVWQSRPQAGGDDYPWAFNHPLQLPSGVLSAKLILGRGLSAALVSSGKVVVRFRRGGERCHPTGRAHSQSLKRLFQEWGTPTWLRANTPLVYVNGELAAVADTCICRNFAVKTGEHGWVLKWDKRVVPAPSN